MTEALDSRIAPTVNIPLGRRIPRQAIFFGRCRWWFGRGDLSVRDPYLLSFCFYPFVLRIDLVIARTSIFIARVLPPKLSTEHRPNSL